MHKDQFKNDLFTLNKNKCLGFHDISEKCSEGSA